MKAVSERILTLESKNRKLKREQKLLQTQLKGQKQGATVVKSEAAGEGNSAAANGVAVKQEPAVAATANSNHSSGASPQSPASETKTGSPAASQDSGISLVSIKTETVAQSSSAAAAADGMRICALKDIPLVVSHVWEGCGMMGASP